MHPGSLRRALAGALFVVFLALRGAFAAEALPRIEVREFTLPNGMLFLVVERPAVPQVAVRLAIRAGSALEDAGRTGIAHLVEHMLFKGTRNFGSRDARRDAELQERIDAAYEELRAEEARRNPDPERIRRLREEMERLRGEAQPLYIPQVFSTQLGKNGAVGVNAFTNTDQTQYVASVPADMLEQWFSIASEQIFEPAWREFYVEKEVVKREWAFRYANDPGGAAWLDLHALAYRAHPYRNPVIGWLADIERLGTRDAIEFHARHYHPANAVCVLVGDVSVAEAQRLAGIYFGRYPAGTRAPEIVTAEPPPGGPRRGVRYLEGARTPLVRVGFHGPRMGHPDFYALDALSLILSQGRSARLTRRLVEEGLAADAWAVHPDRRYAGFFVLGGTPVEPREEGFAEAPEEKRREAYLRACEALEERLLAQVERLQAEPVAEEELARVKKLNRRDFLDRLRSNGAIASLLAGLEVQAGWRYLEDYLERMEAVTAADVQRVAREVLRRELRTTVYVIPGGPAARPPEDYREERSIPSAAAGRRTIAAADLSNRSRYPTPAGWKHPLSFRREPRRIDYPPAQRLTVAGVPVFFLPDAALPLVDLTLYARLGSVDEPVELAGLTELLEETLVNGGTERRSAEELAAALDDHAIHVNAAIGLEESSLHLSVLAADWERGIELLAEILARPAFEARVLEAARGRILDALRRQGEDAAAVALREAMVWHFAGHPYGRDPLAALATLPRIGAADLKAFLRSRLTPEQLVVAAAGDISAERLEAGIRRLVAALAPGGAPARRIPPPEPTPPVLALVHKPGQVQAQVAALWRTVPRSDPRFWKLGLLIELFGGNDSLLYTRLRDDLGYVYAAGFSPASRRQAGMAVGSIGARSDRAAAAIEETVGLLRGLAREVPAEELELKRLDALNGFVFAVSSPQDLVRAYGRFALRGEPLDTLVRIQESYFGATAEELRGLAAAFLDPSRIQLFVVADRATPVTAPGGRPLTLEEDLRGLAERLGIPFREIDWR
mgnify:FL=1